MTMPVETPREQSWREIRQSVTPAAMTTHGRRRLGLNMLRGLCTLLVLGALAAIGVFLGQGFEKPGEKLAPVVNTEPLREVVVLSDGVLTKDWVDARLALPEGIALVAVDLDLMKSRLEAEGQVRSAVVARDFPGTLVVTIEERVPVARAMVALEPGHPEQFFAARDGTVYRGYNYDPSMVARLPWLDGLKLVRRGEGFEPVEGMDRVSEFLIASQHEAPHLARAWRVVSLADLPRLIVRTSEVPEIIFEPGDYRRQLARLDYILDFYRKPENARAIKRVDVSIASQVAVEFSSPPPAHSSHDAASASPVSLSYTPSNSALLSLAKRTSPTRTHRGF